MEKGRWAEKKEEERKKYISFFPVCASIIGIESLLGATVCIRDGSFPVELL